MVEKLTSKVEKVERFGLSLDEINRIAKYDPQEAALQYLRLNEYEKRVETRK